MMLYTGDRVTFRVTRESGETVDTVVTQTDDDYVVTDDGTCGDLRWGYGPWQDTLHIEETAPMGGAVVRVERGAAWQAAMADRPWQSRSENDHIWTR